MGGGGVTRALIDPYSILVSLVLTVIFIAFLPPPDAH